MKENFTPLFKEKEDEQFYYNNGKWIKCGESTIDSLWNSWVSSPKASRQFDEEGFLVFGYE